jgi:hypothetical protein
MARKQSRGKPKQDPVIGRLDALIRLFIEMNKPKGKEKFNEPIAARIQVSRSHADRNC